MVEDRIPFVHRVDAPKLVYALDNGITLCVSCHKKTFGKETHYRKGLRAMVATVYSKLLK